MSFLKKFIPGSSSNGEKEEKNQTATPPPDIPRKLPDPGEKVAAKN